MNLVEVFNSFEPYDRQRANDLDVVLLLSKVILITLATIMAQLS